MPMPKSPFIAALILMPVLTIAQTTPPTTVETPPREKKQRNLQQMDADKDGMISRSEFLAEAEKRFARLDTDKDGQVSKDEIAAKVGRGGQGATYP